MRNLRSHTMYIHTIRFVTCGSYKIALYSLQSAVDGDILLFPVRARHVEKARAWLLHGKFHPKLLHFSTLCACFMTIHVQKTFN